MFNLEQEIRRWRRTMSARLPLHREAINELESHLRDAVQTQCQTGSSPDEAWRLAVTRLGTPETIAAEYGKLSVHAFWLWTPAKVVLGVFLLFVALIAWVIGSRLLVGKADALLATHVFAITTGYGAVIAVGLIAAWSALSRAFRGWSQIETEVLGTTMRYATAAASVLTIVGVLLGSVWAREHMGRYWGWDPQEIGAAAVLAWSALVLGWLVYTRDERIEILLGLVGSLVVVVGWFAPIATTWQTVATGLAGLVIVQLALACLTLVPPGRFQFRNPE